MESTIAVADFLPPGDVESTALGSHYAVRGLYPHDYFHGKVRLSRFSTADLECLMLLMKENGTVPSRDRIVFLDTETTGLQGGAGMCPFLVGLGCFVGDEFHMLQYFIRDFDEEPSMLYALGERLSSFELIVTYNGAAFDIPLLETRFTLARLDSPFQSLSHLDLLFTARRLWRNGHGSCRLTALEREMLSFFRGPDVPGSMIPRVYFDYLQHRSSSPLNSVFTHNVHDVVSLAALTLHACDRVTLEPAPLDDALDLYSLGRILQNSRDWRRSIHLYEMALAGGLAEPVRKKALEDLCVVYRRAGDHERSRDICNQLMAYPDFSMTGYEGAAIYHERVQGDLETAIRVLEEGIARSESRRWNVLLKARWNRLQQKVIRYE
ncbi:MAG TPA: ribonuclease H-like domain-containing protein [Terriglobia bacterium]|nr:ribonuclease H-like domain-containing protein [Terriglobia bacterium]